MYLVVAINATLFFSCYPQTCPNFSFLYALPTTTKVHWEDVLSVPRKKARKKTEGGHILLQRQK